jgi:short-subunit dehydrogenase
MPVSNSHKSILILGAGSDIGIALLHQLFHKWQQCRFYLLARRPDALQSLVEEGKTMGHTVETYAYDLLHPTDLRFYGVNYYIALAGWLPSDNSQPEKSMQVNFTGIKNFSEQLIATNRENLQAVIITGSVAGVRVRPANWTYGKAKAALHQYTRQLANHYKKNFTVTLVIPGYVRTKMIARHTTPAPLTLSAEKMAAKYMLWLQQGPTVVYSQAVWKWISAILRIMPEAIIKRMKA